MTKESQMEVLAEARFTASNGKKAFDITLQLVPSGANAYGNKHALLYTVDGYTNYFDARYDKRFNTAENFQKHAYEFVRNQIRDEFKVEAVK